MGALTPGGGATLWRTTRQVQTQGSLAQTSLAALLEAMQSERATGTLSVTNGGDSCSLYFLFGHLFHAAGASAQGEEAVIDALGWHDGQFTFDPRAKLPAEETIKSATGDLLAEAERRVSAGSNGSAPAVTEPVAVAEPAPPEPAGQPVAPAEEIAATERTTPVPAATAYSPVPAPVPPPPSSLPAPAPQREAEEVFGNPNAVPLSELYPLPAGKPIYEALKSAFVDFPKLLRTLDSDQLTGYVGLEADQFSGVLLLHDGHVLEALYSDGAIVQGITAFQRVRARMERGEGLLDVIELSGETVVALAQLLTARPLFTGLLGRFVNFDALLEYLAEEKVDGSLVVAGGTEMGVVLLRKGTIHGAYTHSNRTLQSSVATVGELAAERTARIEVKAGAGSPEGIDVAAALRTPA